MNRLLTACALVFLTVTVSTAGNEEKPPTLTLVWPDGTKYIGGVVNGKRNGEGTIYWTDGTKFIGQFKNDLRNGPGSMVLPDGTVHSGYFENDKLIDPSVAKTSTHQTVAGKQPAGAQASRRTKTTGSDKKVTLVETTQPAARHEPVTLLTDTIRRALTYSIDLWAAAWSMQNTELYLDLYHNKFKGPHATRRQWEMFRKSRLIAPKSIDVSIAYDRFEIVKPDIAEIRFQQTYKSNLYKDVSTKVLTLENTEDGWKIIREREV